MIFVQSVVRSGAGYAITAGTDWRGGTVPHDHNFSVKWGDGVILHGEFEFLYSFWNFWSLRPNFLVLKTYTCLSTSISFFSTLLISIKCQKSCSLLCQLCAIWCRETSGQIYGYVPCSFLPGGEKYLKNVLGGGGQIVALNQTLEHLFAQTWRRKCGFGTILLLVNIINYRRFFFEFWNFFKTYFDVFSNLNNLLGFRVIKIFLTDKMLNIKFVTNC